MVGTLKVGRMMLGCLLAVMSTVVLSSPAWALDQNSEIERLDNEASQISQTLGRDRTGGHRAAPAKRESQAEQDDDSGMVIQMIPKHAKRSS